MVDLSVMELKRTLENFKEDEKLYGHNREYREFASSKEQKNYEHIVKRLKSLDLPDPSKFKYVNLRFKELKEILKSLLVKVLGSNYEEQISALIRLVNTTPEKEVLVGTLESNVENGISIPKRIYISNQLSSIEIPVAGHEIIHALLEKYTITLFNQVIGNIHYKEELSILIEYILCYELSLLLKEKDLVEKHEVTRLSYLKEFLIEKDSTLLDSPNRQVVYMFLGKKYLDIYEECHSHESYTYTLADIYSTTLLQKYKEDPIALQAQIDKIIKGEQSIIDMNAYYDLSFKNKEVLSNYNDKLNKDCKMIIKP